MYFISNFNKDPKYEAEWRKPTWSDGVSPETKRNRGMFGGALLGASLGLQAGVSNRSLVVGVGGAIGGAAIGTILGRKLVDKGFNKPENRK